MFILYPVTFLKDIICHQAKPGAPEMGYIVLNHWPKNSHRYLYYNKHHRVLPRLLATLYNLVVRTNFWITFIYTIKQRNQASTQLELLLILDGILHATRGELNRQYHPNINIVTYNSDLANTYTDTVVLLILWK